MEFSLPKEVRHNLSGFKALVSVYEQAKEAFLETIVINMGETTWFDADMCAAFGALFYCLGDAPNAIQLRNIKPEIKEILSKNGFLSHYGRDSLPDTWHTTIAYRRFDVKDESYFADYVERELLERSEIPDMSKGLVKKFHESVFEIFSNAILHSDTRLGVFSCGQIYPMKSSLDFLVADLGIGMRRKVGEFLGVDFAPEKAIQWATTDGNTTKSGEVPGGLGLRLLRQFLSMNGGTMQIVSDAGYWCQRPQQEPFSVQLDSAYPGTIVHLKIKTNNRKSYALESELSDRNIF